MTIRHSTATRLNIRLVKQAFFAGLVALALLASMASTADARSERVPTGGDSWQRGCRSLQDQVIDKQKKIDNPKTSDAERQRLKDEIDSLARHWNAIGCNHGWGDIAKRNQRTASMTYSGPAKVAK